MRVMRTHNICFNGEIRKKKYLRISSNTLLKRTEEANWSGSAQFAIKYMYVNTRPLLIFSQSDSLIQVVDINSNTEWQTVQIQIS